MDTMILTQTWSSMANWNIPEMEPYWWIFQQTICLMAGSPHVSSSTESHSENHPPNCWHLLAFWQANIACRRISPPKPPKPPNVVLYDKTSCENPSFRSMILPGINLYSGDFPDGTRWGTLQELRSSTSRTVKWPSGSDRARGINTKLAIPSTILIPIWGWNPTHWWPVLTGVDANVTPSESYLNDPLWRVQMEGTSEIDVHHPGTGSRQQKYKTNQYDILK